MDTNNTVVRLCGKMVIETKGDKELILFPDLPKWAIVNKGGSKFLEYVSEHSLEEIRNTTNQLDYQFVLDALNAGLLIENDPIKYKIENLDEKIFPLISVWLNITSSCNLQCRHCFLGKQKQSVNLLSIHDIDKLMDEFIKVKGRTPIALDITGGEPLLRKDFLDVVKICKRDGIKLSVPTNGLLLNSEIIRSLALDNIPIAISLDGSTKEEHEFIRGRNTYDRTIRNIREAVSNGVDVTLVYSIHKGNQDKTVQFLEFSKQLGVKTVNYSFLNEIGNAYTNHLLTADEDMVIEESLFKAIEDPDIFELLQGSYCARALETVLLPVRLDCCGSGINTCSIGADGEVYPCPSFQKSEYSSGNVLHKPFSEIWADTNTFKSFRDIRVTNINEQCENCFYRYLCGGGCRADACNGGIKDLKTLSPKCNIYKKTIWNLMWLLAEHPELSALKTRARIDYFGTDEHLQ